MEKILVANRGEIALRVMKTARLMGIKTVAIYSEADRNTPHVRFADEAVCVGPAPSAKSYLAADKIIAAALRLGADGIHPGYGFLSENAQFAKAVNEVGVTFIGPSPFSIEIMGSKIAAKNAVRDYDIPMVPGTDRAVSSLDEAMKICESTGFPVLVKASAGGGGKGMRIVRDASELGSQMERAISEATSAFGDGSVFIEKYISSPRHIEIQVLADSHGNAVHLFERECSIQRRHQKVVEEAPSSFVTPAIRAAMGSDAVKVAHACRYTGAGTVEFLMDENRNYYFLEMNTRLQVEHPVTELVTGLDLVEQQIRIARGEALAFTQHEVGLRGHALELRVYAEDPANGFLPGTGRLDVYQPPSGQGIRVDDGYEQGLEVPIYYDPLLAKLCSWGATREEAIRRMLEAIARYRVEGVPTTLPFGRFVLSHEAFVSGNFDTHFVEDYFNPEAMRDLESEEARVAAQFSLWYYLQKRQQLVVPGQAGANWWGSR